jgi:hemolysin type calcium-binding protein
MIRPFLDARGGGDSVTVDDLSQTSVQEVHTDLGAGEDRLVVNSTDEDEQSSISGFGGNVFVLAATFVQVEHAEPTDRLRLNGRGLSTSTAAMKVTLDAGDGGGTVLGGPGDDVLLGGDDFDLVQGGKGDDVVNLGGDFDSCTWRPGDGDDRIDGGTGSDGLPDTLAIDTLGGSDSVDSSGLAPNTIGLETD